VPPVEGSLKLPDYNTGFVSDRFPAPEGLEIL
jgi:hypothetical protein